MEAMLHKGGAVPAAVFRQSSTAVEAVFVPVAAQNQAVLVVERQVVLPVDRVAVGFEHAEIITELIALGVEILAVALFQARLPALIELGVDITAGAAHGVIGRVSARPFARKRRRSGQSC